MKLRRVSIAVLFIAALSGAALAGQGDGKEGTQGTEAEPDCDYTSMNTPNQNLSQIVAMGTSRTRQIQLFPATKEHPVLMNIAITHAVRVAGISGRWIDSHILYLN